MAYLDEHIGEYRVKRDDIMNEVTDTAGESTKIPRLQQAPRSLTRTSMSLGLSITIGDMPRSSRLPTMTGTSESGLSLRARAQASRTSMLSVSCRTRKDV